MAITKVNGAKGANGTNGAHPTAGGKGDDATFTQNGKIGADSINVQANGGDGGKGGKGTGIANGADGGNGGNANITLNGNIFNAPATTSLNVLGTSTGGDGGLGGLGVLPGAQGNGGNAAVTMSGNIIQTSKTMTTVELNAQALGGNGTRYGNASATLNGNIIQLTKATTVTLEAGATVVGPDSPADNGNLAFGTKTATVNGNIVSGNITNVNLFADAYLSNGTANINGNIVTTTAATSGTVTLEAQGQHIAVTNNKFNLGKQELDIFLNELGPTYDVNFQGNEFTGNGTNTFVLNDSFNPGPPSTFNSVAIDLGAGTLVVNGQANKLTNFASVTLSSDINASITGNSGNNTINGGTGNDFLSGAAGNDTLNGNDGNDILFGGTGNDALNGGNNTDVAYFTGREKQYTVTGTLPGAVTVAAIAGPTGGPDGTDTLTAVERIKFLSPSHVSDIDNNGTGDLVFQNGNNGNIQIRQQAPNSTLAINGVGATWKVIGTGQFTADTDRKAGLLLQDSATGNVEVITGISGPSPTTVSLTTSLSLPVGVLTTGFTAITAGDFNGDAASDVLMQNNTTGNAQILFLNVNAGEPIGQVDSAATITSPGTGWNIISSGDFNGDGKSDILWNNSATGKTEVFLMNGGTVATTGAALTSTGLTAIGSGDFNNDGKSDVLFQQGGAGGNAVIWTMNGAAQSGAPLSIAAPTVVTPGDGFVLKGAEDINADGFSDLLFADSQNNVKAIELTTGGAVLSTVTLASPAAAFHLIASTGGA